MFSFTRFLNVPNLDANASAKALHREALKGFYLLFQSHSHLPLAGKYEPETSVLNKEGGPRPLPKDISLLLKGRKEPPLSVCGGSGGLESPKELSMPHLGAL